ncbi:unnamed protein product [Rhodiola kirilowii]
MQKPFTYANNVFYDRADLQSSYIPARRGVQETSVESFSAIAGMFSSKAKVQILFGMEYSRWLDEHQRLHETNSYMHDTDANVLYKYGFGWEHNLVYICLNG